MDNNWNVLSKKKVLESGKFLSAFQHTIQLPDGRTIDDWIWLSMPDYINVVVVDMSGRFIMLRQSKYGIEGQSYAPVGGFIEPGEEPLSAAKRETLEEIGYEAPQWTFLGSYRVDPNRGCGTAYAYLATGAEKTTEPNADDLEAQEIVFLNRVEVEDALYSGGFKVLPWANNVAMALLYLK